MLPMQILLNNFLYDLSELAIPTDSVDDDYIAPPAALGHGVHPALHARVRARELGVRFPDVLPAATGCFGADEALFQTGWFVESLRRRCS